MNSNRNKSINKKVPNSNKLQVNLKKSQKNQQEELGSEFNPDSAQPNHNGDNNKNVSERTAWN